MNYNATTVLKHYYDFNKKRTVKYKENGRKSPTVLPILSPYPRRTYGAAVQSMAGIFSLNAFYTVL